MIDHLTKCDGRRELEVRITAKLIKPEGRVLMSIAAEIFYRVLIYTIICETGQIKMFWIQILKGYFPLGEQA